MNIRTMQKLEREGWPQDWLDDVKLNFHPKKKGKYQIKIYSIDELDDNPEDGILLDATCFSTELELSIVHHFFEGQAYVMTIVETGKEIGRGIIDGAPFDEVSEHEENEWWWKSKEASEFVLQQKAAADAKPKEYIKKPRKKIYVVVTQSKRDYDFSVETIKHGAFNSFSNAVERLQKEVKKFKKNHKDDRKEYTNKDYYEDELNGAWTEYEDFKNGYWSVSFGFEEHYENHTITVEEFIIED